jgi:hypothetical protein
MANTKAIGTISEAIVEETEELHASSSQSTPLGQQPWMTWATAPFEAPGLGHLLG